MPTQYITYYCDICGKEYEDHSSAKECEDKGIPKPRFKIGEIVTAKFVVYWNSIPQSRPVKIVRVTGNEYYDFRSHHKICYEIAFVNSQDRIERNVTRYFGYDNLEDKTARILLYKRKK